MYGLMNATKGFTSNFKFSYTDWKMQYFDVDFDLKEKIESITPITIVKWIHKNEKNYAEGKTTLFTTSKTRLYLSDELKQYGYRDYEGMLDMLENDEMCMSFFTENDIYMSIRNLQSIVGDILPSMQFTQSLKKLYSLTTLQNLYNNKPYVKCTFIKGKLKIIG